jgi:hypothetical protein
MSIDAALTALLRLLLPAAAIAAAAFAVMAVLDRLALDELAAERRALMEREALLTASVLAPGSALACLDGNAGETIETACEAAVFSSPQNAAAAVAYTAARLALLANVRAHTRRDPAFADSFATLRRSIELDRFGLAAHVLATRDGCTAERCAAFALIADATALKANLKVQVFEQYVSRHMAAWSAPAQPEKPPAVSEAPAPVAPVPPKVATAPSGRPVSNKYDFPSAASIPPVSIMNAEPALPKEANGNGAAPAANAEAAPPVPPRRPQTQTPPAR